MNVDPQLFIEVVIPVVAALGWLFRLEGRVNRADERHDDLKADIQEIKGDVRKIRSMVGGGVIER